MIDFEAIERAFNPDERGKCAEAANGMVASAHPVATSAAVDILRQGGNAVDAACACALALAVCEPQASGIGGQTMMLIYIGKKVIAIDGSSRAPSLAHTSAIYKEDRGRGYRAATVPSTLATLGYTQGRYGRLRWEKIVAPAIRIAAEGYPISKLQHHLQNRELHNFQKVESGSGIRYFLKEGGPYNVGDIFKQPDLQGLLTDIAVKGVEYFYLGNPARRIDADMRENGGLLRYDDLAFIPWPIERAPLKGTFRKLRIYSMPPPGAGRSLLFTLAMLNAIPAKRLHRDPTKRAHFLAEILRHALFERSDRPFDPNFYPQVSGKKMLNARYARECVIKIGKQVAPSIPIFPSIDESPGETTHLSVMDKNGMAVSLTQSIERVYGSKAAAAGLGFLYNNYLMDFEYKDASHPFYLRPNSVPWATVAPSLIFNREKLWMALGSPGSERIMSAIAQFLMHVIDERKPMDQAIREPRLHCSLGGRVSLEAGRFPSGLAAFFESKGYRLDRRKDFSFYLGAIHAVLRKHDDTGFQGVAEVRRDGTAGGI